MFVGRLRWQCGRCKAFFVAKANGNSCEQAGDESDTLRSIGKMRIDNFFVDYMYTIYKFIQDFILFFSKLRENEKTC